MRLGIDIDGVIFDTVGEFRRFVYAIGNPYENSIHRDVTQWNFSDWQMSKEQFSDLFVQFFRSDRIAKGSLHDKNTAQALKNLSNAGHHITLVTSRFHGIPELKLHKKIIVQNTMECLDWHSIYYDDVCFLEDKSKVDCDIYLDDAPHNIKNLKDTGYFTVIFDQLYNRHLDGPRVLDFSEFETMVNKLAYHYSRQN